jgi:hypothetical protein
MGARRSEAHTNICPSGTLRAFKITLEKQQAFVIGYPGEFDLDGRYQATPPFTMRFSSRAENRERRKITLRPAVSKKDASAGR